MRLEATAILLSGFASVSYSSESRKTLDRWCEDQASRSDCLHVYVWVDGVMVEQRLGGILGRKAA